MAILSCFQDFFYSLNAKAHREPDLSAIRWSRLLGDSHFGDISLNSIIKSDPTSIDANQRTQGTLNQYLDMVVGAIQLNSTFSACAARRERNGSPGAGFIGDPVEPIVMSCYFPIIQYGSLKISFSVCKPFGFNVWSPVPHQALSW